MFLPAYICLSVSLSAYVSLSVCVCVSLTYRTKKQPVLLLYNFQEIIKIHCLKNVGEFAIKCLCLGANILKLRTKRPKCSALICMYNFKEDFIRRICDATTVKVCNKPGSRDFLFV